MQVIIMRGIPGSGKTTALINKTRHPETIVVSADHYFIDDAGVYRFNPLELPKAHDQCLKRFIMCLDMHKADPQPFCLIVDNTNITSWEIAPYYRLAEIAGADVKIIRCVCSPLTALKRNTHGVPAKLILDMHNRLNSESLPPWWKEEILITE